MMFSCCHPRLPEDVQTALVLNILCGFGAGEIAGAFLAGRAAIEKRLARGKKTLSGAKRLFDLADADFAPRVSAVRRALYLLFNEGYHGASAQSAIRADLCHEAIRLTTLLVEHPPAATPETHALAALMCLHAARLPARSDNDGGLHPLFAQDRSRWDAGLVTQGLAYLERSASGCKVTAYHLEAAIAAEHAGATTVDDTDWPSIVALYDRLMTVAPSPVVALNRAVAIAGRGIQALHAIADRDRFRHYPFYPAALGELELRRGNHAAAQKHFAAALALARNPMERRSLEKRVRACGPTPSREPSRTPSASRR
jgi:predicted RNA polymerase sigma factor